MEETIPKEWDKFYDDIKVNNTTLFVSIKSDLAKFGGYKVGDIVEIRIRKVPQDKEEEE